MVAYEGTATNLTNPWGTSLTPVPSEGQSHITRSCFSIQVYLNIYAKEWKITELLKWGRKCILSWRNSLSPSNTFIYAKGSRISITLYTQCQQVNEILVARSYIPAKMIIITAVVIVAGPTHDWCGECCGGRGRVGDRPPHLMPNFRCSVHDFTSCITVSCFYNGKPWKKFKKRLFCAHKYLYNSYQWLYYSSGAVVTNNRRRLSMTTG